MTRAPLWNLVDLLRVSAAARWTAVRQLRWQTRAVLSECRARRRWERSMTPPAAGRGDQAGDGLEADVLRVISRHPEGVSALDIGNELGVDWRRVPAVAARLVERFAVEQVADQFYPVKKAS